MRTFRHPNGKPERPAAGTHRVVVVGGGFGGLYAVQSLLAPGVEITLVDRRNFHLFQPLLYQVATGELSPANIAAPLRSILKRRKDVRVLLGEVRGFDLEHRRVELDDGSLPYDSLIVAAGSENSFFGHTDWEQHAPALKSVEDATEIRRRILLAFEMAERESDPHMREELLTFVIVGGGPTGVELAGAIAELVRYTLRSDFRSITPSHSRIILLEGQPRLLPTYTDDLSQKAKRQLEELGVTVRTGVRVTDIQSDCVTFHHDAETETIATRTVLWAAGVQASGLGRVLAEAAGIEPDRHGRVAVEPDLSLPGHREVFLVGDIANYSHQTGEPLPGVAPVAMQEARYVARLIRRRLAGRSMPPFRYRDYGTMATIGRARAVAMIGPLRFSGLPAWLMWLFIHLMYIVQFENRLLILLQWAWNYVTWNRSARLITGEMHAQPCESERPAAI